MNLKHEMFCLRGSHRFWAHIRGRASGHSVRRGFTWSQNLHELQSSRQSMGAFTPVLFGVDPSNPFFSSLHFGRREHSTCTPDRWRKSWFLVCFLVCCWWECVFCDGPRKSASEQAFLIVLHLRHSADTLIQSNFRFDHFYTGRRR